MGIKDEFGVVDSCHKQIDNTFQLLESMHITLPNECSSSNELDEHSTGLTTKEIEEHCKRGVQATMQEVIDSSKSESMHGHPSFFAGEFYITTREMEYKIGRG